MLVLFGGLIDLSGTTKCRHFRFGSFYTIWRKIVEIETAYYVRTFLLFSLQNNSQPMIEKYIFFPMVDEMIVLVGVYST